MAAPVELAALANTLQALTSVLQKFQSNTPAAPAAAAPAAAAPAAHVNILDAFKSVNPFNIGS